MLDAGYTGNSGARRLDKTPVAPSENKAHIYHIDIVITIKISFESFYYLSNYSDIVKINFKSLKVTPKQFLKKKVER